MSISGSNPYNKLQNKIDELKALYSEVSLCEDLSSMQEVIEESSLYKRGKLWMDYDENILGSLEDRKIILVNKLHHLFEKSQIIGSQMHFQVLEQSLANLEEEREKISSKLENMKKAKQRYSLTKLFRGEHPQAIELEEVTGKYFSSPIEYAYQNPFGEVSKSIQNRNSRFLEQRTETMLGVRYRSPSSDPSLKHTPEIYPEMENHSLRLSRRYLENPRRNLEHLENTKEAALDSLRGSLSKVFDKAIENNKHPEEALLIVKNYAIRLNILQDTNVLSFEDDPEGLGIRLNCGRIEINDETLKQLMAEGLSEIQSGFNWEEGERFFLMDLLDKLFMESHYLLKRREIQSKIQKRFDQFIQEQEMHREQNLPDEELHDLLKPFYKNELPQMQNELQEEDIPEEMYYRLASSDIDSCLEEVLLEKAGKIFGRQRCMKQIHIIKCETALENIRSLGDRTDILSNAMRRRSRDILYSLPIQSFPFEYPLETFALPPAMDPTTHRFMKRIIKKRTNDLYESIQSARKENKDKTLLLLCEKFIHLKSLLSEEIYDDLFETREEKYAQASHEIEIEELAWKISAEIPAQKLSEEKNNPIQKERKQFIDLFQNRLKNSFSSKKREFEDGQDEGGVKELFKSLIREEIRHIRKVNFEQNLACNERLLIGESIEYFSRKMQKHFSLPAYLIEEFLDESIEENFENEPRWHEESASQIKMNLYLSSLSQKRLEKTIFLENLSREELSLFLRLNSQCREKRCRFEKYLGTPDQAWNIQRYMNYKKTLQTFLERPETSEEPAVALKEEIVETTLKRSNISQIQQAERKVSKQSKSIYEKGSQGLSEFEVEHLLLFQKVSENKQITEEENEKLCDFFSYIANNKPFNQRLGTLLREEGAFFNPMDQGRNLKLFKYGLKNETLKSIRYISFKTRRLETFRESLNKAESLLMQLKADLEPENKLSFQEYNNLLNLHKLSKYFQTIRDTGFHSEDLETSLQLANQSKEIISQLEELFQNEAPQYIRTGDFLMGSNPKKAKFTSSKETFSDHLWDFFFSYHHARLAIMEKGVRTSEICMKYKNEAIDIEEYLKNDVWHLNLSRLPFTPDFLKAFKAKYKERWEEKIQEDFEAITHALNRPQKGGWLSLFSYENSEIFSTVWNDRERRHAAGKAKFTRSLEQREALDFKMVEREMSELKEHYDASDKMFCSEFVVKMTLSALVKLQEKYKKEFRLEEDMEAFSIPFPPNRRLETVDPGSLISIFQKQNILEKAPSPPILRKIFREDLS